MKKRILLFIIIGFILGVIAAVSVYFVAGTDVEWKEYIETVLLPSAVSAAAAIGSLYIGSVPLSNLVKAAANKFTTATEKVTETVKNSEQTEKTLAEYGNRIFEYGEKIAEFTSQFDEIKKELETSTLNEEKVMQMLRIAFCNTDELVKKGYAAKIWKVGEGNEETES